MKLVHVIGAICLTCTCSGWTLAQDSNPPASSSANPDANPVLKHRPAESPETPKPIIKENIDLTVPKGTALQVVLDREIRVQKVGQPIHGLLIEPVYAFDKLVVPIGTEVTGQISQIESVSAGRRTLAALDANLTPTRKITVEFTELSLAGGKHIPIQTSVVPGSGQVIRFVTASENQKKKGVKDIVTEKERQAKQEARRQFDSAMQQVKEPGKLHRVERYAVAQLPVHPQYIDAGTMYFAELGKPLEFGSEPLTPEIAASMNSEIPEGTMVHARLTPGPLMCVTSSRPRFIFSESCFFGGYVSLCGHPTARLQSFHSSWGISSCILPSQPTCSLFSWSCIRCSGLCLLACIHVLGV